MPKKIPNGKEIFYIYTVTGYKEKLMKIAEKQGITLTDLANLIFAEALEKYETRKSRKLK